MGVLDAPAARGELASVETTNASSFTSSDGLHDLYGCYLEIVAGGRPIVIELGVNMQVGNVSGGQSIASGTKFGRATIAEIPAATGITTSLIDGFFYASVAGNTQWIRLAKRRNLVPGATYAYKCQISRTDSTADVRAAVSVGPAYFLRAVEL